LAKSKNKGEKIFKNFLEKEQNQIARNPQVVRRFPYFSRYDG